MFYLLTLKETIDGAVELRVLEWHRAEGDRCATGSVLVELESFKAVIEIRVQKEVYLRKILVPVGGKQFLGKAVAVLSDTPDEEMPRSFADLQEMAVEYLFM